MGKYKAVLFDFDGTVMDTNQLIISAWQHTYKTLTGSEGNEDYIVSFFGEILEDTMRRLFPEVPVEEATKIYRGFQEEIYEEKIRFCPGMDEILRILHEQGYKLAIVTSRFEGTTRIGLKKYDLDKYFDVFVTCESTDEHKPKPGPILVALDKLGVAPNEAIMVGDSTMDIVCAKNAGVESILVGWAMPGAGEIMTGKVEPDYKAPVAMDIVAIVNDGK